MAERTLRLFKWATHVSGTPFMKCSWCRGRINHQGTVLKLDQPKVYGAATDDPTTITHEAWYYCECKKTRIIVEGTMPEYQANGCILTEVQ